MSDISELFQRDPLSLTKDNLDDIIKHYRDARAKYLLGEGVAKPKKPEKKPPPVNLTLDDLGI